MEQFIMKGGNPLVGEVTISGAKNAALGILAASILTDEDVLIENLPDVRDINVFLEAVSEIGAMVDRIDRHTVRINAKGIHAIHVDDEYIRRIRASYYFIGALLGKYKSAQVPLPGGCNIGSRPIDQHLKGFRALGAKVQVENGAVLAHAIDLVGTHIYLDMVSVGATINIMMAATLAEGETIIENPAKEPHVVDVANFLNSMGANVKGAGTDVIRIRGVHKLHGTEYSIIPDQIEAGTFMCAAAITRGDVMVQNVIPKHLEAISAKLIEMGCEVTEFDEAVRVVGRPSHVHTDIKTLPYPGFPTDMQPQITVTLALAEGTAGNVETFVEYMNDKAEELGMKHSHFDNPVGLDKGSGYNGTYTTAADFIKVSKAAMENPLIAKIVAKHKYKVQPIGVNKSFVIKNTNAFYGTYKKLVRNRKYKIIGSKTGTTRAAGHCLVATAVDEEGNTVICAFYGNGGYERLYKDIRKLLDYAFARY